MTYWVRLKDGTEGCIGYDTGISYQKGDVKPQIEAALGKEVEEFTNIPYPAHPLLLGNGPTFCFDPKRCAGKSSCPRSHSCCD